MFLGKHTIIYKKYEKIRTKKGFLGKKLKKSKKIFKNPIDIYPPPPCYNDGKKKGEHIMDISLEIEGENHFYNPTTGLRNELKLRRAWIDIDHNMGDPTLDHFYIPIQLPDLSKFEKNESGTWIIRDGFVGILTGLQLTSKYKELFYHTYQCPLEEYDAARTKIYNIEIAVYNFIKNFGKIEFCKNKIVGEATDIDAVVEAFDKIKTEKDSICELYKPFPYSEKELRRESFYLGGEDCVDRFIAAAINYEKTKNNAKQNGKGGKE